jgi:GntR family transcriptional repressor for pyruvate dehydrogenase complex
MEAGRSGWRTRLFSLGFFAAVRKNTTLPVGALAGRCRLTGKDIIFSIFEPRSAPLSIHPLFRQAGDRRPMPGRRLATLSSKIVAEVRDALFEKRLKPGDFLGSEKEIAARSGASRIVARDALRTLEAMGIVEIRPGAGGGARITRGNPQLFAEALAVQLELADISASEILDAQRAVECLAAELAAEHATPADLATLRGLLADAESKLDDVDAYTRSCLQFHLAVAEASHNRVLVFQLASLQHVSWPARNRTLTRSVARHVLAVHRELADLIESRDAGAARRLMDEHVRMIRARRVAERGERRSARKPRSACC